MTKIKSLKKKSIVPLVQHDSSQLKGMHKYIFDWFKKKYNFGELGLFEAACVASIYASNLRTPASAIIIAPAGEAKSDIMMDVSKFFDEAMIIRKGVITEYWIIKNISPETLDKHTLCINDLADSLKSMQSRRIAGFLSFVKNVLDGEAEILNIAHSVKYKVNRVNVLVNIPKQVLGTATGNLISTTFFDRTIPFQFATAWKEWKVVYLKRELSNSDVKKIAVKEVDIDIPWKYEHRIVAEAEYLRSLKLSGLPRNINLVKAILCGLAILNGRNHINEDDFKAYSMFKVYFRW